MFNEVFFKENVHIWSLLRGSITTWLHVGVRISQKTWVPYHLWTFVVHVLLTTPVESSLWHITSTWCLESILGCRSISSRYSWAWQGISIIHSHLLLFKFLFIFQILQFGSKINISLLIRIYGYSWVCLPKVNWAFNCWITPRPSWASWLKRDLRLFRMQEQILNLRINSNTIFFIFIREWSFVSLFSYSP